MGMIGLETVRVSPPGDSDAVFVLRTALSTYECEKAKRQLGFSSMGEFVDAVGSDGLQDLLKALGQGRKPEDIAEEMGLPEDDAEAEEDADAQRAQYDMNYASKLLIKSWNYRDLKGRKMPVTTENIAKLDRDTLKWLHDRAWDGMREHLPKEELEGNS